jgi:uncharacterized membrane protein
MLLATTVSVILLIFGIVLIRIKNSKDDDKLTKVQKTSVAMILAGSLILAAIVCYYCYVMIRTMYYGL